MFDSPLEYCPRCREYVALDLTQRQCAARHLCGNEPCPLEKYFTGTKCELEPIAPECPYDQETHGLSPAATSLLSVIAEHEQPAFSGLDLAAAKAGG